MNPDLDLGLDRIIRAPASVVWDAWTDPASLASWWLPAPTQCRVERLDTVPGGAFVTSMSEDGDRRSCPTSTPASSPSTPASGSCSPTRSTADGGRPRPSRWR